MSQNPTKFKKTNSNSIDLKIPQNKVKKTILNNIQLSVSPEEVVVLHLEYVLLLVLVHGHPRRPRRHLGLGRLLLGDEGRAAGGLGDLDPGQTGFLKF